MGVDVAHLVFETLCNTDDQVVDESLDCAEGGDILAGAVMQFDGNDILRGVGEADGKM